LYRSTNNDLKIEKLNEISIVFSLLQRINITNRLTSPLFGKIVLVIGVILLFWVSNVFAEPRGMYESTNFKISNLSAIYQGKFFGDNYDIVGIIKNIGNKTTDRLNLIVTLYNKTNGLIGVEQTIPILDVAEPNSSSPFKFDVLTNISQFDHYLIQIGGR
jgi:hypothetical protein